MRGIHSRLHQKIQQGPDGFECHLAGPIMKRETQIVVDSIRYNLGLTKGLFEVRALGK